MLRSALVELCADRADLLAHAVRAAEPRLSLRPFGMLCGTAALEPDPAMEAAAGVYAHRLEVAAGLVSDTAVSDPT